MKKSQRQTEELTASSNWTPKVRRLGKELMVIFELLLLLLLLLVQLLPVRMKKSQATMTETMKHQKDQK